MIEAREAEGAFLAQILLDPRVLDLPGLDREDFLDPLAYRIVGAAMAIHAEGRVPDLLTLGMAFPEDAKALAAVSGTYPSAANAPYFLGRIHEAARARRAAQSIADLQKDLEGSGSEAAIAKAATALSALSSQGAESPGGFRLARFGTLELRPPKWLVKGLIESDSLALVFGDPAGGKSFFGLDLAASIATGTPFHGHDVKTPGPVVYIAGEGHSGLARRLRAWEIHTQKPLAQAPLFISSAPAALCEADYMARVASAIDSATREAGPPVLLVLDTWSRSLAGDENSTGDVALAISALDRLRARYGCAALAIHHVGHADKARARGSTVLRGAVDTEFKLERGVDGIIRVENTKMKDGCPPAPMAFVLCDVDLGVLDEDGCAVTSAVLVAQDFKPESAPRPATGARQKEALAIFEAEVERHRKNVSDSGRDPDEARVSIDAWKTACAVAGIDRRRFSEIKLSLLDARLIDIRGNFVFRRPDACPSVSAVRPPLGGAGRTDNGQRGPTGQSGQDSDAIRTKNGQGAEGDVSGPEAWTDLFDELPDASKCR